MPIRAFLDEAGIQWQVWATIPYVLAGVTNELQRGWLTFESDKDRRRLAPIPDGWEDATVGEMRALCKRAASVARSTNSGVMPRQHRDPDA